jgi:hypothetical protein
MLVVPVPYVTPEGAERNLRFSQGAKRRIAQRFGAKQNIAEILQKEGDDAIVECAYAMMYDEDGKPPSDLSLDRFYEAFRPDQMVELLAAVMSAVTQGETPKNELEALFGKMMSLREESMRSEIQRIIGPGFGASVGSASDLQNVSSGGQRRKRSKPASSATTSNSSE